MSQAKRANLKWFDLTEQLGNLELPEPPEYRE